MEYEDRLSITTPEGVELELTLAGIGSRSIAAGLDLTIQALTGLAGAVILSALLDGGLQVAALATGGFLLIFTYDVLFEVLAAGRTPGKRWTGLRVVRESGAPVTFLPSAIRNAMRLIDILPAAYAVGMTVVFLTRRNQRLGDLAAGTVIVRERHGGRRAPAPVVAAEAPMAAHAGAGWDTSAVTADDLMTVRAFLDRREHLHRDARDRLAADLAARLRAKVAGAPDGPPEAFLEALVAQRSA